MKFTQLLPKTNTVQANFNTGDFFLSSFGKLRQVVCVGPREYAIMDPKNGNKVIDAIEDSAQAIVQRYVNSNGAVKKVEVNEIVFTPTNEVLEEK